MAGANSGYDLSVSTFSPDGRIFQLEYAAKAVDNSGTCLGVVCKDGVLLAVEKLMLSKMLIPGTDRRIFSVDKHITMAIAGMVSDARQLVGRAREEATQYKRLYGEEIPARVLAERVASFAHMYTMYGYVRPFGASVLIGANDSARGPELYCVEPSGSCTKYFAHGLGKSRAASRTLLEKDNFRDVSCQEAVSKLAKIVQKVHDQNSESRHEVEMAWICPQSEMKVAHVPQEMVNAAVEAAQEEIDNE
eukprot:GDKJ01018192.1.p1 GENE.GDKJ01018192.1~~GDKJ01018192.1.p1  ORF type:complete len:248 (+),score=65.35 GDKJ01018192.1:13-756(+)